MLRKEVSRKIRSVLCIGLATRIIKYIYKEESRYALSLFLR